MHPSTQNTPVETCHPPSNLEFIIVKNRVSTNRPFACSLELTSLAGAKEMSNVH